MARFGTAWKAFWSILKNQELAESWAKMSTADSAPAVAEKASPAPVAPVTPSATPATPKIESGAVHALVVLQREGRLIDFLQENLEAYDDAQVGAAVREIHANCQRALGEHFGVQPVESVSEGESVTVESGFDPSRIRLTGNVSGEPPFTGTLRHKGWRVTKTDLPERSNKLDPTVIFPAEVEL
jgi:hypothetical protein